MNLYMHYCPFIVFFIVSCNSNQSGINDDKIVTSYFSKDIIIGSWRNDWSESGVIFFEDKALSDNSTTVKTLWNGNSLYFRFEVKDNDLRACQTEKDHPGLFLDDMVEILIDTGNDKDSCWTVDDIVYHINLLGVKKDDRGTEDCQSDPQWDGRATFAILLNGTLNDTTDIDSGYVIEMSIPWTELDIIPKHGLSMGINFANGDNDGNGRQLYDWAGAKPMRSPYAFGTIFLADTMK